MGPISQVWVDDSASALAFPRCNPAGVWQACGAKGLLWYGCRSQRQAKNAASSTVQLGAIAHLLLVIVAAQLIAVHLLGEEAAALAAQAATLLNRLSDRCVGRTFTTCVRAQRGEGRGVGSGVRPPASTPLQTACAAPHKGREGAARIPVGRHCLSASNAGAARRARRARRLFVWRQKLIALGPELGRRKEKQKSVVARAERKAAERGRPQRLFWGTRQDGGKMVVWGG